MALDIKMILSVYAKCMVVGRAETAVSINTEETAGGSFFSVYRVSFITTLIHLDLLDSMKKKADIGHSRQSR